MKFARFAAAVLLVSAVIAVYRLVPVNHTTVALTLLLAILGISTMWGLAEATLASVAAVLGFNFFFLPPVGTLTIQDPQNWVALLAFLVTAVTASQLSERARRRAAEAEARRLEIERLYELVRAMTLAGGARNTIREFVSQVVKVFGCKAAALFYASADETFRSGPESNVVSDHDLKTAAEIDSLSIDEGRAVALAPVRLGGRPLGSAAFVGPLPSERTLRALLNVAAISIEKARALEEASHAEAERQSEALKSALLDSLAHDIKTPLTSIKAAVTTLLSAPPAGDRELLTIIDEEADRLNRLAAEVIAMARVAAGKLHLEKSHFDAGEVIGAALDEFAAPLRTRSVDARIAAGLPPAEGDRELIEQVVKQFVENALKYTPADSPLVVSAERRGPKVVFGVTDRGPGIPENERLLIFGKFYRGRQHRFSSKGTGMGLAIAKGIIEAHGERIWVESEPGQGAAFYFSLPASRGEGA